MTASTEVRSMADVIGGLTADLDSLPLEDAIALLDALGELKRSVNAAHAAVEVALTARLDEPHIIEGKRYEVTRAGKWRPQHPTIKRLLIGWALVDRDTGEAFEREQAVQRAVELTYDAFVAPSAMPKKRLLEALGVDTPDVASWEDTGPKLVVTDVA